MIKGKSAINQKQSLVDPDNLDNFENNSPNVGAHTQTHIVNIQSPNPELNHPRMVNNQIKLETKANNDII